MKEKVLLQAGLCFLISEGKVILAKKQKHIGRDCWNGYGGGIEKGETPEEATVRELGEESGGIETTTRNLEKVAIVDFHNTKEDGEIFICQVHIYLVRVWYGSAKSTDEMVDPTWFDINDLPFSEMLPADREWLPIALSGKKITAEAWYGPHQKELLRPVEIREVEGF